ncbi:hypothetical protein [Paracoccus denitrificans]|jgi:hypothetical protein|nr:hypothetical protein [Paracoccus denitrificans]QAR28713.1 hypothetical protein EO213_20750 [Paracoccus denitrificans]WQO36388.1 hypothetical protein U0005_18130 [Paracoccus denitrificans]SDI84337.1 hypothetical protein SAMN04244581_02546 [Paracoccus denitrificans]SFR10409.1 hypothetical protein SAMN04244569_02695 [Paracoccus denitrificans]GEK68169.1 hypothetical protein PDE01_16890 [Paracoccus denitrificans]
MGRIWSALALASLAACGDTAGDYPALMPTDRLLAEPALPGHAADAARDPAAVGGALDARGRSLAGRSGTGPAAHDAELQRRADALRARARALSQQSLAEDCPEGSTDCPPN